MRFLEPLLKRRVPTMIRVASICHIAAILFMIPILLTLRFARKPQEMRMRRERITRTWVGVVTSKEDEDEEEEVE